MPAVDFVIVAEGSVGTPGESQDVLSLEVETLEEVVGIGFGDGSAPALFWRRDFGYLLLALRKVLVKPRMVNRRNIPMVINPNG